MNDDGKFNLLWTICWLLFVAFLCFLFHSMNPLWLLIIWFFQYIIKNLNRRVIWKQEQLNLIIINNGRLAIVDYYDCWEELRHKIGKYLEEKGPGGVAEDGEKYCVALAADELLNWMSDLEYKHKKYLK